MENNMFKNTELYNKINSPSKYRNLTYDDIKDGNISSIFSIIQNNLIPYDTEESSIKAIRNLYNKDNLNIFFEKNFFNTDERIKLLVVKINRKVG